MKYNWRIIDSVLRDRLDYAGAVLVQGAKWCGKTTSCEQIAKSVLYMADPERRVDYLQFAETNVNRLLKGESAATVAAFAAKDARAVQDVDVAALRARLRADGQRFE